MAAKHAARSASSKHQKEVEKLPPLLRPYEIRRIDRDALEKYQRRKTLERARACFDPDDRHALDDEWLVLHHTMMEDIPQRCRKVFALFFIEGMTFGAIARRLRVTVRTAKLDLRRALEALAREQPEVEREGVVAKRT